MQPVLNNLWTKNGCFVTLNAESRDPSGVWHSCEYVYTLPERVKRSLVVNRSHAGQILIRTNGIYQWYAGYFNAGACLTPKREEDQTSQQQMPS
jgi:hypothetical protein